MRTIRFMNLASIDLNLLVAFEALMLERNVTRAGARIGLAQPSMSNALMRLRALFDDALFIRTAHGMKPTSRALTLAEPVGVALDHLRAALASEPQFDPRTARQRFSIAATDYGDLIVVPAIVTAIRREAPNVDLVVRPVTNRVETLRRLEHGEVDVLLGGHFPHSPRTIRHSLFQERFVCIRDGTRAAGKKAFRREDFLRSPHAWFSSTGGDDTPSGLDSYLVQLGLSIRVAVTLPHVVAVPFVIAGTDLIATLSERVARRFAKDARVAIVPLPFDVLPYSVDLVISRAQEGDLAMRWLVNLIRREASSL
jgi:DNA-binding transcriptional LysR family regulator